MPACPKAEKEKLEMENEELRAELTRARNGSIHSGRELGRSLTALTKPGMR
jgi:hypothetical protein